MCSATHSAVRREEAATDDESRFLKPDHLYSVIQLTEKADELKLARKRTPEKIEKNWTVFMKS